MVYESSSCRTGIYDKETRHDVLVCSIYHTDLGTKFKPLMVQFNDSKRNCQGFIGHIQQRSVLLLVGGEIK